VNRRWRATARWEAPATTFRRWVVFSLVGGTGFFVQLAVMTGLMFAGLHYLVATTLAVEAAVLNNFLWHQRWTWRDRVPRGSWESGLRLVRFNLTVGSVSVAENLVLMKLLVDEVGLHYLVASLVAMLTCGIANFLFSHWLVFRPSETVC
jgi:dolichol-phosphate mannosyltransferase